MVFSCRALALVIALAGIGQLYSQPFDTLSARTSGFPVDTLIVREKAANDPRMKVALLSRLVMKYLYLDRQEECMSTSIRTLEIAEPTKNDTLIARAHLAIGTAFAIVNDEKNQCIIH